MFFVPGDTLLSSPQVLGLLTLKAQLFSRDQQSLSHRDVFQDVECNSLSPWLRKTVNWKLDGAAVPLRGQGIRHGGSQNGSPETLLTDPSEPPSNSKTM